MKTESLDPLLATKNLKLSQYDCNLDKTQLCQKRFEQPMIEFKNSISML